jgi:hypothetical protein
MTRIRNAAGIVATFAFGFMLLILGGCDEEPQLPAEVERLARQREEADERALDELERKRSEVAKAPSASESSTDTLPQDTPVQETPTLPPVDDSNQTEATNPNKTAEPPAVPTSPVVPPKSAATLRWSELKSAMTAAQVVELLGKPTSISSDAYLDYWTYGQGRAAGRVAIIRSFQRLIAWDPPID